MAEPFVTLTDFAIALQTAIFACWLWPLGRVERFWALTFTSVGLAALAGGTYHGLGEGLIYSQKVALWQTMVIALSVSSFWLLVASVWALPRPWRLGLLVLAGGKLALFLCLGQFPWPFAPRVVDYLITLVLVPGLWWVQKANPISLWWLTAGVAVSVSAALVLGLLPQEIGLLNSLTTYHLLQMVGLYCIFRGIWLNRPGHRHDVQ